MSTEDEPRSAEEGTGVAPIQPRFSGVRRIAVLRAGGLGDLLFAVPAIEALVAAYPAAEVTLLGSPVAHALWGERPASSPSAPHRVLTLPPAAGVGATEDEEDRDAVERFLEERRGERYDLAVQLHGGGRFSNPFLLGLGARHTVGARTADAAALERNLDYVYYQHEVLRALEIAGLAGASPVALQPRVRVTPEAREAGRRVGGADRSIVAIHGGATDPRRRWPAERFAEVAARLISDGVRVVLVGDERDVPLCRTIAAEARERGARDETLLRDVSGRLTLPELAGLLAEADVLVGNDSGPRHLAEAVGTATVSVYWCGNLINAGPLGRGRHRAHIGWTTSCSVCGRDSTQPGWTAERCEHDPSFVADVPVDAVHADVVTLREREAEQRAGSR